MTAERRHALFIAPSNHSVGELSNAIMTSRSLVGEWRCFFLVGHRNLRYAMDSGVEARGIHEASEHRQRTLDLIRDQRPDLIVLADHYIWAMEPTPISIEDVVELGVPVVAHDSLNLGRDSRTLRFEIAKLPDSEVLHRWFPPEVTLPALPDAVACTHPVPVAGPGLPRAFDKFRDVAVPAGARRTVREQLQVPDDHKLVVVAQSAWAGTAFTQLARARTKGGRRKPHKAYDQMMTEWLVLGLEDCGVPVTVAGVSRWKQVLPQSDTVDFASLGFLDTAGFADLLSAADLYVTDNLTSGAMAHAAYLGSPVLALVNSRGEGPRGRALSEQQCRWRDQMAEFYPGFAFPWLVNPYGWTEELADLMTDNPYLDAVPRVDVLDADLLRESLQSQLGPSPDRTAHDRLHEAARTLPSALDVYDHLLDDHLLDARTAHTR